jgi:serine/threonine-protein kinase RsbW
LGIDQASFDVAQNIGRLLHMTSDAPARCSITVQSTPSVLEDLYKQILNKLKENDYSDDDIFGVHLALEEGFINAVKHGNKMDESKTVKVDYVISPEKVEISITDQGQGFVPDKVPDPRIGDNLYRPDGRGLLLIGAYMDTMEYRPPGNCLFMAKYRHADKNKPV